jgi:hypothetical protein
MAEFRRSLHWGPWIFIVSYGNRGTVLFVWESDLSLDFICLLLLFEVYHAEGVAFSGLLFGPNPLRCPKFSSGIATN